MRIAAAVASIALVAVAAGWASGCGSSGEAAPRDIPSKTRTFSASETRIVGARAEEQRALREILQKLEPTQLDLIRFRNNAPGWGGVPRGSLALWFHLAPPDTHGEWEAHTAAFLYLEAAEGLKLRKVEFVGAGSDHGQASRFLLARTRASENLDGIRRAVRSTSARVVELRSIANRTLALTVRVDNPPKFLRDDASSILGLLGKSFPNQLYFGVEDGSGAVVFAVDWTGHGGGLFVRPELDGCSPVAHSHYTIHDPLPCLDLSPIREAIASTGARTAELRMTIVGLRVAVRTDDPAVFLKRHYQAILDTIQDASPRRYSFHVEDGAGAGEVVYRYEQLRNTTGFWARPDLESCGPVRVIGRMSAAPPPLCPA